MFIDWVVFALPFLERFCFCLFFRQAAIRWLTVVSALVPMAQMKPSSSRATAVVRGPHHPSDSVGRVPRGGNAGSHAESDGSCMGLSHRGFVTLRSRRLRSRR